MVITVPAVALLPMLMVWALAAVPILMEPLEVEEVPTSMVMFPAVPEAAFPVSMVKAPDGAVPEAPPAPVVIPMVPPVVAAPAAAPAVMVIGPPAPVVVPAEPLRINPTPAPVEEGLEGMMFRVVPAAVDSVVRSPAAVPPFKARTPVAPARVAAEPLRVRAPEVLPRVSPTELVVPTSIVPEAA
jgi:hypothetical protein